MVADKESLQLKFDFLFRTIDLCMGYRNPASGRQGLPFNDIFCFTAAGSGPFSAC